MIEVRPEDSPFPCHWWGISLENVAGGVAARRADNGKLLWLVKKGQDEGDTEPFITDQSVIISDVKECSVFALDLESGRELWRVAVPDCAYYYYSDD